MEGASSGHQSSLGTQMGQLNFGVDKEGNFQTSIKQETIVPSLNEGITKTIEYIKSRTKYPQKESDDGSQDREDQEMK